MGHPIKESDGYSHSMSAFNSLSRPCLPVQLHPHISLKKQGFVFNENLVHRAQDDLFLVLAGPGGKAGVVLGRQRELELQQQKHSLEIYFSEDSPLS